MRHTRFFAALWIAAAFAVAVPFVPSAQAAGSACFCNINGTGATLTSGPTDAPSCQTTCGALTGYEGYLWATDSSQYPGSLLQCYASASVCEKDVDGDGSPDGTFDSKQPSECLPGSHYCYSNSKIPYTLQISIPSAGGSTTTVENFGDYIGVMYQFLLGFAMTVAIVFVMVGGIRYVIGASTGEIGKAKDMIMKAVSGFVLLMFAYVILYTVNPNLLKLQPPQLPMIRRVELLTGANTCESLKAAGYTLGTTETGGNYGNGRCGSSVDVLSDGNGNPLPDGTTCQYSSCAGTTDAGCAPIASGDTANTMCFGDGQEAHCLACSQITPDNTCGVTPSEDTCNQFTYPVQNIGRGGTTEIQQSPTQYCFWTRDPDIVVDGTYAVAAGTATAVATVASGGTAAAFVGLGFSAAAAADMVTGSCATINVNCAQVDSCRDYDDWQVYNDYENACLDDLTNTWGGPTSPFASICKADPCVAHPPGYSCTDYEPTKTTGGVPWLPGYAVDCVDTKSFNSGAITWYTNAAGETDHGVDDVCSFQ